ncbi:MAG TPA: phosphatase PAP2 family protein [Solirubrobacterales bacterium]|nr:phosphatase PAP2 family protein [Solirubrobacterales bacterium]
MFERPRPLRPRPRAGSTRRGPLKTLGRLDQKLLVALRTRGHSRTTERVVGALGTFGEWGLGWIAIGAVGAGLDSGRREAWWAASAVGPAAVALNYAVKLAVGRERPLIEDHPRLARAPSKLSFPSAHSTSSVAAATAMGRVAPGARAPLTMLALAVCLGRPYLGMHYPSDVLAGMLLGREIGRHWPLPGLAPRSSAGEEIWAR